MEFPSKFTHKKMVGIILLDGFKNDWRLPYSPYFAPIAEGLTLIDNAVLQCAFAGCRQIFILCNEKDVKLLRHNLGEWVEDPNWWWKKTVDHQAAYRVQIPIYYIRMSEKDKRQRGSAAWGIISAAMTANRMAGFASKWTAPAKFFVTFPWTATPFWDIGKHRADSVARKKVFYSHNGRSAWEGEYLPFTFDQDDLRKIKKNFRKKNTLTYRMVADYEPGSNSWFERLPKEQQRSGRFFTVQQLVEPINKNKLFEIELNKYYNVFTWENYKMAVADYSFKRPRSRYLKAGQESRILQRIGVIESE